MKDYLEIWLEITKIIASRYFIIAGITYFLFYFLLKNRLVNRKIQERFPNWKNIRLEMFYSTQAIIIFATVAMLVIKVYPGHTNMYGEISDYGWMYYFLTFPLMLVIHDTYFYWMHRAMHSRLLFRKVHLTHHRSTNPTPWASYSFHFYEAVIEAGIIPIIAFTLPVHKSALVIFLLYQFFYNVYGHLGYELMPKGFHKSRFGRWINTSVAHNMHHEHFKGNYGLYFLFWDRVMGTLHQEYDQRFDKLSNSK
ncbi:MAG: sterol desaturase family protein [Bacteroidota bacterium]